jgi:uncharacterized damage-inducible protein DinB
LKNFASFSGDFPMQPFFSDYYQRIQELHQNIQWAIAGLPHAALDWVPGEEMNSLTVLVVHLCGAERFWIGDVVGQDPSNRERASEFQQQGWEAAQLDKLLQDTLEHTRGVLEQLTLQDLETQRTSPRDEHDYTVGWALAHALEHTALHTGHIQITRDLWDHRS